MALSMRSLLTRTALTRSMETTRGATRYFGDDKGRVLSEEERAAENVYIKVCSVLFVSQENKERKYYDHFLFHVFTSTLMLLCYMGFGVLLCIDFFKSLVL